MITGALLFLGAAMSAQADTFTFDFNGLSANSAASLIASSMTASLVANGCTGCSVSVSGAVADQAYNGEGHVVGPGSGGNTKSLTLGNTDGATVVNSNSAVSGTYDTFLANTNDASHNVASQITMKFTGLTIGNVSFDYEIFPDGTCPSLGNCGAGHANLPSLEFKAGALNSATDVAGFGSNSGTQFAVVPGTSPLNTNNSPLTNTELAPQYIGVSGNLALGSNVAELDFVDWPATIGIDNLKITYSTTVTNQSTVPEPSSLILLFTTGLGCLFFKKKQHKG